MLDFAEYVKIFVALLVIVNPIGTMPMFLGLTHKHSAADKKRLVEIASVAKGEMAAALLLKHAEAGNLDAETLRQHGLASLAGYKVPRRWVFIDELPRNPTGKVIKRELAEGRGDQEDRDDGGSE